MARQIYVNLAVQDLQRAVAFFTTLGFKFNPQFADESATCMIINDDAYVMLLVTNRFKDFTKKTVCDSTQQTEAILALSADSREQVDEMVQKALDAGGRPANDRMDHGFMYAWSFQDPDGHLWEVMWMDPKGMPQ